MEVFTMVVAIVAIACVTSVISDYLKTRRATHGSSMSDGVQAELDTLKQRVAVLEEIVTDERYRLDREIDKLSREASR